MKNIKKAFLLLLVVLCIMATSCKIGSDTNNSDAVTVDYFCSVGAYLNTLQSEIDKWNETTGKEKGVFINLISDIATYTTDLLAYQNTNQHFALYDCGVSLLDAQIKQGYIKNLYEIDNSELKEIVQGYDSYIQNGVNIIDGKLAALPLEIIVAKLAVNIDLFEKNNLSYPKTWDDVLHCARVISNNETDNSKGFGWSTWSGSFNRFLLSPAISETGKGWWDPNTGTYSFSQYKPMLNTISEMYKNGYMMGADDLDIDQMRAQFAEGNIGMFIAYSYDYAVLTDQFPAKCNWTLVDYPITEGEEAPYKSIYMDRVGCSISKIVWDNSSEKEQNAIVDAFCFLNSDGLNKTICEAAGMIPYKSSLIEDIHYDDSVMEQWAIFCNVENSAPLMLRPDNNISLEGDDYEKTLSQIMHGYISIDDGIASLEERYNNAYDELKETSKYDLSIYNYSYDVRK